MTMSGRDVHPGNVNVNASSKGMSAVLTRLVRTLGLGAALLSMPRALIIHATAEGPRCLASVGFAEEASLQQLVERLSSEHLSGLSDSAAQAENEIVVVTSRFDIPQMEEAGGAPAPHQVSFVAAMSLQGQRGKYLGTLWFFDEKRRSLSKLDEAYLRDVAHLVTDELESLQGCTAAPLVQTHLERNSEEFSHQLLNTLCFFAGLLDLDGTLIDTNQASLDVVKLQSEDVIGRPFWDCYWWAFSEESRSRLRDYVTRASVGETIRTDVEVRLAENKYITVDFMLAPFYDASGSIIRIVASGVDISRRELAEVELDRMARIVEEAPFLIRSATPDGRVLYLNRHGRRVLGYGPANNLGNAEVSHHHPEWAMRVLSNDGYVAARSNGQWLGETAIIDTDGREVPVSHAIVAHRNAEGSVEYFSSIAIDISGQKAAEEALKESELRFRGTFENAAVGMAHMSLDGRWLRVNERLLEIVGYGRAELVQMTFEDITHPDDIQADLEMFQKLKDGEIDSYSLEKRCYRKDESIVWVEITVSMQETSSRMDRYVIAIIEDISERKVSSDRQRLLLAELNHRVKNTLAMIQSIANQTLRQTTDPRSFVTNFTGRLQSLSEAHDLLTAQTWDGADLAALLRTQVTLNGTIDEERVRLTGPSVLVSPQVALNLAIIIHELATNALQHGAFANNAGRVEVNWSLVTTPAADERHLEIVWVERGGQPVRAPGKRGFGSILLERGLKLGLGGDYELDWASDGLVARLTVPLPKSGYRKELFAT